MDIHGHRLERTWPRNAVRDNSELRQSLNFGEGRKKHLNGRKECLFESVCDRQGGVVTGNYFGREFEP
jgi:hypothetical protein